MQKLEPPILPGWLASQLPFERYLVDVEGHRFHVMEAGDPAGLPVLMLHGNPTWGYLWRKVASRLAGEKLRLIMPDLIGLGFSDKPLDPGFHQLATHGRLMAGLLDALGVSELVFAGQDWGGPIGLYALAERPRTLRGLVLANTVVGPPKPGFRATPFHRFARMPVVSELAFRVLHFPQVALWGVQGDRGSIRGAVARAYRYPLRRFSDNVAPLALARMVPDTLAHPSIPALARCQALVEGFTGKAALVWGERDPVLGRVLGRLERLLPSARVTRTRAGHFLQEEVPDELAEAIASVAKP